MPGRLDHTTSVPPHEESDPTLDAASGLQPGVYSVAEAAKRLGVSDSTVYHMIKKGTFPVLTIKLGSSVKVSRNLLERYLQGETE